MKKIQCISCGQIFWTDLNVDEALVADGEWVQNPCPKCGSRWAVVGPKEKAGRGRRPKATGAPKRQVRRRRMPAGREEKTFKQQPPSGFSPANIRRLRKKLGTSQKGLASLLGVSTGSVVSWEGGKFQPRKDKVAELSDLAKWNKEDVRNLLAKKESQGPVEPKPEAPSVEKKEEKSQRKTKKRKIQRSRKKK